MEIITTVIIDDRWGYFPEFRASLLKTLAKAFWISFPKILTDTRRAFHDCVGLTCLASAADAPDVTPSQGSARYEKSSVVPPPYWRPVILGDIDGQKRKGTP